MSNSIDSLNFIKQALQDFIYELKDRPSIQSAMNANIQYHINVLEQAFMHMESIKEHKVVTDHPVIMETNNGETHAS